MFSRENNARRSFSAPLSEKNLFCSSLKEDFNKLSIHYSWSIILSRFILLLINKVAQYLWHAHYHNIRCWDRWYQTIKNLSIDNDIGRMRIYKIDVKLTPFFLARCEIKLICDLNWKDSIRIYDTAWNSIFLHRQW